VPPETAREFFDTLESRADTEKAADITATYLFVVEGAGEWTVDVEQGRIKVSEGRGDVDVTLTAKEDVFRRIVSGKQNPLTAYMTGKLKVSGDMSKAMKLQKLF
jgi:putative sterol carrier protein